MSRGRAFLAAVAVAAALLRFSGLAWDGWNHQHPDERFLVMVSEQLALPASLGEALDPARTPANPNNRGYDFYVYGALPPMANRLVAGLFGVADYRGLLVMGRTLTVVLDVVALLLLAGVARRLGGERAGLAAALAYGACPLLLQQSRFATTDTWGLAAVALVVWAVVAVPVTGRRLVLAGLGVGLAAACKPNLVLVALVPSVAAFGEAWRRRADLRALLRPVLGLAAGGAAAVVAAKVLDPGLFSRILSLAPNPRRVAAVAQLASFLRGEGQFPPALQWADRTSVLEPLATLLGWGTGPLLGVAVIAGGLAVLRRLVRGEGHWLPVLVWAAPVSAWHLSSFTGSVRHLLPVLPLTLVAAAVWLAHRPPWVRRVWLTGIAVWGVAWAAMAWQPHTRVEASRWMAEHLPPGAVVTAEYWDDALPLPGTGGEALSVATMRVFDRDTEDKREHVLKILDQADAVVLSSQRGVGSIPRVPDAYPLTSEYYHLLFSGSLGFELAAHFHRAPGFGPLRQSTLAAEEVLSVYDHPPVWVFRKNGTYDPALARRLLERVPLPHDFGWNTRELTARGVPPYLKQFPGKGPSLPGREGRGLMGGVAAVIAWLLALEMLGLAARAGLGRWLQRLPDGGWGAARTFGLMGAGVVWLWCGWLAVPGWNGWLPTVLLVIALPWAVKAWKKAWRERGFRLTGVMVWAAFLGFLAIRMGNPEVYWGEKPMEAAILASLWQAPILPPAEPWFAGSPLHYYFFGFLPFGLLGRALDLELGVVFNLSVATIPALAMGSAMSLGWLLARRALGGVLAAVLAQVVGTAAVLLRPSLWTHPSFDRFWAATRVIPDTINEFPPWTALFADLHPHFIAFPGFLAGVLAASAVAVGRVSIRHGAVLGGAVLGCQFMTNTWEVPALAALLVAAALVSASGRLVSRRVWAILVEGAVGAVLAATLVSLPFWRTVRLPPGGIFLTREKSPALLEIVELFGIPLALAFFGLLATILVPMLARQAWHPPARRRLFWAWVLVGAGVVAILVPEVVTVADRMNTVFKFQLLAHLLLGVGLAAVLAGTLPALPGLARTGGWALVSLVIAVGLATTLACTRAVLATRRVPGPRPALDGAAYLSRWEPGTGAALAGIGRLPYGTVVIEPPGPPYSDSLRVPMFTGNPAVVGWEYHLWQRRQSWAAIGVRQDDLLRLFYGEDQPLVDALVRRYRVGAAVSWGERVPAATRGPGWHPYLLHPQAGVWLRDEAGGAP